MMRTLLHTAGALLLGAIGAFAQTQSLTNADQVWHGAGAGAQAGAWMDIGAVSSGDGRSDLIVGAPGNASNTGAVYVIFGGPVRTGDQNLTTADTILSGAAAGDLFGSATAAGNVITPESSLTRNLVVAAPGAFGGKGAVYVFTGAFTVNSSLTTANAVYTIVGRAGDQLGTALATADLDNDGYREIIIGAPGNDRIYVIKGGASLSGTLDLSVGSPDVEIAGTGLGEVLAAGDITGDGISDLIVGSGDQNTIWVFKGRASGGLPPAPDFGFVGERTGDRAGSAIRLLDIDHDGVRDLIIGAPNNDGAANNRADAGATYLLWGGPALGSRSLTAADVIFYGGAAGQLLGAHIGAGDVNRDTPSDIVMTAPGGGGSAGELDIYYGRSDRTAYGVPGGGIAGQRIVDLAISSNIDRRITGDASLGSLGATQVFEVTGEGARDIVVSVPTQDSNAGAVYFTISPSLVLSSSTLNVAANKGGTSTSLPLTITNRSIIDVTWAASSNQAWMTPSPTSGSSTSTTPGMVSANVNTGSLAAGVLYTATMNVSSTSKHLEMTIPVTVNMTITDMRASIDTPGAGAAIAEPFLMTGYAIDASASSGTGVDQVQVYAYRNDGSGAPGVYLGNAAYGSARSDVAGTFGSQFMNSGYSFRILGLTPGPYRLVIYPRNPATQQFPWSMQTTVTVNPQPIAYGGDFDGDFMGDLTLYKANGDWAVRTSSSNYTSTLTKSWGGPGYTPVAGDFDGDGKQDFGVYREATGDWFVLLSGSNYTTTFSKNWGGPGYKPMAADYDGDGKADPGVYDVANGYWYVLRSSTGYSTAINVNWGGAGYTPVAGLDFDGDAKADITVYNRNNGTWYALMSGTGYTTSFSMAWGGSGYVLVPGDYDGDGKTDLGLYNRGSGRWSILKSSSGYTTTIDITSGGAGYTPVPGDYDGDGRLDLATFQRATGLWTVLKSSTSYTTSFTVSGFGTGGDTPMSRIVTFLGDDAERAIDVDGDNKADMTLYNVAAGYWYTLNSSSGYTTATNTAFGGSGYAPVPGDFDGDGKADRALYQASSGNWYVLLSSTNFTTSLVKNCGGTGWMPVPGDYDGDGKTDFAVYNTTTGQWFGLKSSGNYTTTVNVSWGGSGYTAAPADFDGDGKTDLGVYNTTTGVWSVLLSSSGFTTTLTKTSGGTGFVPMAADFDGDGKADFAAYNTTSGMWTALLSGSNYTTTLSKGWGGSGYAPVTGDFDGDGQADLAVYQASSGYWYILLSGANYTTTMSKNWGGSGYAAVPVHQ